MKNFKLLLATTAILSTGFAMNVKAIGVKGNETAIIPVFLDIVAPISFTVEHPLDFGRIMAKDVNSMVVDIDNSGVTSITSSTLKADSTATSPYVLEQGGLAIISGTDCTHISLPSTSVSLTNSAGSAFPSNATGSAGGYTLTNITCETDSNTGKAKIYGKLYLNGGYMMNGGHEEKLAVLPGRISGEMTVTAVYDERADAPTPSVP